MFGLIRYVWVPGSGITGTLKIMSLQESVLLLLHHQTANGSQVRPFVLLRSSSVGVAQQKFVFVDFRNSNWVVSEIF